MPNIVIVCLFHSLLYNDTCFEFLLGFAILMAIFYIRCFLLKATTSIYCTQYINGRSNFKWTTLKTGAVFAPFLLFGETLANGSLSTAMVFNYGFHLIYPSIFLLYFQFSNLIFASFFTVRRLGFFLLLNFNFRDFFFSVRWMKNFKK